MCNFFFLFSAAGSDWLQGCWVSCDWEGRRGKGKGRRGICVAMENREVTRSN